MPQRGSGSSWLPSGAPFSCTHVHALLRECLLLILVVLCSAGRGSAGRGSEQRSLLDVPLTVRVAKEKGLSEKGGEALQPPAAGYWGLDVRKGGGGHLPAHDMPSCGHRAAGPRQCSGPDGVCGRPSPRQAEEIPLQVWEPL